MTDFHRKVDQFPQRLRELREDRNMTQSELGELMGLTAMGICHWEKGDSQPGLKQLAQLSHIFDVSVDYLLGKELM